jgi:Calx-beta domain/Subtilase family
MTRWLLIGLLVFFTGGANAQMRKPVAKLSPSLARLNERYTAYLAQRSTRLFTSQDPLVPLVDNNRVAIDATAADDVNDLRSELMSLGMIDAVAFGRIVSGHLPVSSLSVLSALRNLQFARPPLAITNMGSVTSQGDAAQRSSVARTMFGVTGSGVMVGVLSDSFNCLGGAAADMTSGDLPPVTVLQEEPGCSSSGTDEGRAMLQIVHDVAPGASLAFATAFAGQANFANNIVALKNSGAKVIVDDVIYPAEPMFQDGIIAQAVDSVVAAGVSYFSSAGNNGRNAYVSAFRPGPVFKSGEFGSPFFFGGIAHNFSDNGTDVFQRITLPNNAGFLMIFQWDSPSFSVSGAPGSPNDIDVYILNATATQVLAQSALGNVAASGGTGDPSEFLSFVNTTGATADFNIMITNFEGPNPALMKYVLFGFDGTIQEFATNSGTLYGHANAAGAEAVGAAAYVNTPAFGVSPPVLNSFSSAGTTPILFGPAGNRLAPPDLRAGKPEIVAPDGADTTFFGTDTDGTLFPNFFGTSAAAPHAAGVAALLLENQPSLTPFEVYAKLENAAINMGAPGFDNDNGFGLIQADAAFLPSLTISDVTVTEGNSGTVNAVFTVTFSTATAQTITVNFATANGTATAGNDYVSNSGLLTFNPGETSKNITVVVNGDTAIEANETFFVNLTSSSNASIADGQGVGTIANDDAAVVALSNLSTRVRVLTGDSVMIGGFVIEGLAPKSVLIRARGPSMGGAPFFIPGTLANPFLRLFSGSTVIAQNDDWQTSDPLCANTGFACGGPADIAATALGPCEPNPGQSAAPPGCTQESAILITLPPGAYTAIQSGFGGATGIGLIEVFEADGGVSPSELINISTRGRVETGDNVLIGGFVIEGSSVKTVGLRARGPSMAGAPFFVPGTLPNPFLRLFSGSTVIASNDNWRDLQPAEIIAAGLNPCEPNPGQATPPDNCAQESAMVVSLPPGAYTAIVTDVAGGTGIGMVEVFEID